MNNTPTFSPFATQTPPPVPMFEGETAASKKGRGKANPAARGRKGGRKPKLAVVDGNPERSPTPAKAPTKRKARVTRSPKFELGALQAFAGLKAEDAKLLTNLVAGLSTVNKKSRVKIVAALAKVFA
jgi:hypothetical protein